MDDTETLWHDSLQSEISLVLINQLKIYHIGLLILACVLGFFLKKAFSLCVFIDGCGTFLKSFSHIDEMQSAYNLMSSNC